MNNYLPNYFSEIGDAVFYEFAEEDYQRKDGKSKVDEKVENGSEYLCPSKDVFQRPDEPINLVNRCGNLRALEEGLSPGEQGSEVILSSKHYIHLYLATFCGFIAAIFSFIDGIVFIIRCPENWFFPSLLSLFGLSGTIPLHFMVVKIFQGDFVGFKRHEKIMIDASFIILACQWLIDAFILSFKMYDDTSFTHCSPKFYCLSYVMNLIALMAFARIYILLCINRKSRV